MTTIQHFSQANRQLQDADDMADPAILRGTLLMVLVTLFVTVLVVVAASSEWLTGLLSSLDPTVLNYL
jgi:hypothetical protein